MRVGFIGVGRMGWHMARQVADAGHAVIAYDPRAEVIDALPEIGIRPARDAADVARQAEITILMVMNGEQATSAVFGPGGYAEGAAPGSILVSMASLRSDDVDALAERAADGFRIIDAPVSGGVEGAEAGTLTVMASGPASAIDTALPVLEAMGTRIYRLGDKAGLGSVMKSVNQSMFLASLVSAAEMVTTAVKAGIAPDVVIDVAGSSSGDSWALRNRLPLVWRNAYVSGGALDLMVKDLAAGLDLADRLGVDAVTTRAALQIVREAYDRHDGIGDDPLIVETIEARSGVKLADHAAVE